MEFKNPYWTPTTKIELLQGWIIVHSLIYYEYNDSIVSDADYDSNSMQLVKMMEKYPKSAKLSRYSYCFKGYDGSTGFDIAGKLTKKDDERFRGIIEAVLLKTASKKRRKRR